MCSLKIASDGNCGPGMIAHGSEVGAQVQGSGLGIRDQGSGAGDQGIRDVIRISFWRIEPFSRFCLRPVSQLSIPRRSQAHSPVQPATSRDPILASCRTIPRALGSPAIDSSLPAHLARREVAIRSALARFRAGKPSAQSRSCCTCESIAPALLAASCNFFPRQKRFRKENQRSRSTMRRQSFSHVPL
jgi:hypothetical protein